MHTSLEPVIRACDIEALLEQARESCETAEQQRVELRLTVMQTKGPDRRVEGDAAALPAISSSRRMNVRLSDIRGPI